MEHLLTLDMLFAFLTLSLMEVILGIDNIIFISILTNKLPKEIRARARFFGIGLALVTRILMLLSIKWIMGLTEPFAKIGGFELTGRGLILFSGGMFLLIKSVKELYLFVGKEPEIGSKLNIRKNLVGIIIQIALLDIVFSFDSILTAIGMTDNLPIMIAAIVVAMVVMLCFSGVVSDLVEKFPSLQILALTFLVLIGFILIFEAIEIHVPKSYIYAAVGFSLLVELINMRARLRRG
ncbi:MAG: TerC family protein [Schleiferiaceae bacterium]|nr:TerC family protein [Schleiferiaceae bacterium]